MLTWTLDTPLTTGDLDPDGPYREVCIAIRKHSANEILGTIEYGNTVDGRWVAGRHQPDGGVFRINMDELKDLRALKGDGAEKAFDTYERLIYNWLAAKSQIGVGAGG